jgi:hypothetical protein
MSETARDTGIDGTPDTLLEIVPHILAEWGQRTAAIVCRHVSAWEADRIHIRELDHLREVDKADFECAHGELVAQFLAAQARVEALEKEREKYALESRRQYGHVGLLEQVIKWALRGAEGWQLRASAMFDLGNRDAALAAKETDHVRG